MNATVDLSSTNGPSSGAIPPFSPSTRQKVKQPGKQHPQKALVAQALIEQGYSIHKTAKLSGLSASTILNIKRAEKAKGYAQSDEQRTVDAIRATWQSKCAITADAMLSGIDQEKISAESAKGLVTGALELAKAAGLIQATPVEHYHAVMHKFERAEPSPLKTQEIPVIATKHGDTPDTPTRKTSEESTT